MYGAARLWLLNPTRRGYLLSVVLAVVLVLASGYLMSGGVLRKYPGGAELTLYWWSFSVLLLIALFVRHGWPSAALALSAIGTAGHMYIADVNFILPIDVVVAVTLYTVANRRRPRWTTAAATGALLAGVVLANLTLSPRSPLSIISHRWPAKEEPPPVEIGALGELLVNATSDGMGTMLILAFAAALGNSTSVHREYRIMVEQRTADLERERRQHVALATAAERSRIGRELHDVVAHSLTVIVAQAQAAVAAHQRRPELSAAAMNDVITTGRSSLTEMRRLLGTTTTDVDDEATAGQPGLGDLPSLVDRVRAAGTPVRLRIDGAPVPLPPDVDLTAYRIVQEALTNTLKHAPPGARVDVRLAFDTDHIDVEVTDDGTGVAAAAPAMTHGNGLRGIAERASQHGGWSTAGPRDGGGFTVTARLHLTADPLSVAAPATRQPG